jgi:hypothetical protein
MAEEDSLNLETLLAIIILFIYTVTGPILKKYIFIICMKIHFERL